jgi:competence protein ComFC
MRCILCYNWSFDIICKKCQTNLLVPSFHKRVINDNFEVYSFYKLDEIQELVNTKYQFYGDRVLNILAKLSFGKFGYHFLYDTKVATIPIQSHTQKDFCHTAILAHHLKSKYIQPYYFKLVAQNDIKYAGKSLEFRQKYKRDFIYTNDIKQKQIILVDDIVTTGSTLTQARQAILKTNQNIDILFGLTLCDAKI